MAEQVAINWTAEEILEFLHTHAADLRGMGVRQIGLFGSYARGDQQPGSDMDFVFSMDHLTWTGWMDVWNFLEDSLGVDVDLVPEQDLRPELQGSILSEVRVVEGL
jgi:hypothetical protein